MIIDLSVTLSTDTPVYPGDPRITIEVSANHDDQGYLGHSISLGTHSGTHIDAPAHMLKDAPALGELPLETFVGPGKVINGMTLEAVSAANIHEGDIVLFDTGTSHIFHDANYFSDYPVLSTEVVEYLLEQKVKMIGLDTCSADNVESFPVHKKLLAANIPIVENLTNLDALAGQGFEFYALPLKLNLDGAPVRAFAVTRDA